MKRLLDDTREFANMTAWEIVEFARLKAGLTNRQVANGMALGEETVARYQRRPREDEHPYELGIGKVRTFCRAVGNLFVPAWVDVQSRMGLGLGADEHPPASLPDMISRVNKEATDVVNALLADKNHDGIPDADPEAILQQLVELQGVVDLAKSVAQKKVAGLGKAGRA